MINITTIAFLGDLGSGKTTLCTRQVTLTKLLHPEKTIYSNYHLTNQPYQKLDLMDLYLHHKNEKNLIVVGDEFYTMMDARVSGSYRSRIESYFITMTRKKDADLYVTMQYETFTDCRLAPFIKVIYIMEKIPIRYEIIIDNRKYSYVKPHPYMFKCYLFDKRNQDKPIEREFLFDGRRWFREFNTDEVIYPPDDIILNVELNTLQKKVKYEKLKKQARELNIIE